MKKKTNTLIESDLSCRREVFSLLIYKKKVHQEKGLYIFNLKIYLNLHKRSGQEPAIYIGLIYTYY